MTGWLMAEGMQVAALVVVQRDNIISGPFGRSLYGPLEGTVNSDIPFDIDSVDYSGIGLNNEGSHCNNSLGVLDNLDPYLTLDSCCCEDMFCQPGGTYLLDIYHTVLHD